MIEFVRHTGEDGIEVVLEFDPALAIYYVSAKKGDTLLTDSFEASWPDPKFGPDIMDMTEANQRVEVLCQKLNDPGPTDA